MGFSTSAVMAIFLAATVLLFSTFYDAVNDSYDAVDDSRREEEDRRNEKISTVVSVNGLDYNRVTSTMNFTVDNDGGVVLSPSDAEILVDGALETSNVNIIRVNGALTDVWAPEDRALFSLTNMDIPYNTVTGSRFSQSVTDNLASAADVYSADRIYVIDGTALDIFDLDYSHDSTLTDAQLTGPESVSASSSYIYVQDTGAHVDVFTLAGSHDSTISLAQFSANLNGIDVGNSRLLVADATNGLVLVNLPGGTYDTTISTNLVAPDDVACGDTHYYVLDNGAEIDAFDLSDNSYDATVSGEFSSSGEVTGPISIAFLDDYVYILDDDAGTLHLDVFNDDGTHVDTISDDMAGAVALDAGNGIIVSRGASGLNILNLGTKAKMVTDNGVSAYELL